MRRIAIPIVGNLVWVKYSRGWKHIVVTESDGREFAGPRFARFLKWSDHGKEWAWALPDGAKRARELDRRRAR